MDLDAVIIPVMITDLTLILSGLLLIALANSRHIQKEVAHLIIITYLLLLFPDDLGWKLFASVSKQQKKKICSFITDFGVKVCTVCFNSTSIL